jgi:protein phosphatase 1L
VWCSELAVARAIGSAHLKRDPSKKALIATAEVTTLQLQQQDDFVIVATDGLWDRINSNEAVSVARRVLCERPDAAATSRALVERAQRCGSGDNISVITLLLHNRGVVVPRSNSRLFKRPATPSPAPVPAPAATAAAEATAEAAAGAAAAAAASPPPAPAAAPAAEATAEIN